MGPRTVLAAADRVPGKCGVAIMEAASGARVARAGAAGEDVPLPKTLEELALKGIPSRAP